jgi:hypothetical protein
MRICESQAVVAFDRAHCSFKRNGEVTTAARSVDPTVVEITYTHSSFQDSVCKHLDC